MAAQTPPPWSAIPYPAMGQGSAACDHLGEQGDVFCFGLRCTAENVPEWFTYQIGGDSVEGETRVSLVVDGRAHSTLPMKQANTPQGEWSFAVPFDPARDRAVVDQLKSGSGLYVLVGGASGAQLSLRGSSREIDRALSMCQAGGQTPPSGQASAQAISEPHDAVLALASKQGCEATESEIFAAITTAGFSDWDANQYVVIGSKDGSLKLIDRTNFKYRIAGCKADKNALAVNSDATELAVTADQLPQPVRATVADIAATCGNAFRTEGRSETALLAEDIDGDGTYDFLLDHAQFCPDAITTMCGASHCPMTLFVSDKGAWRRFDFIVQGYKEFTAQGFLFQCNDPARKAGVFVENGTLIERNCQ
jgi:hypothetical protein